MSDVDDTVPDADRVFSPPCDVAEGHVDAGEILVVRRGPGANCSSVGSVLDVLFLSATFGGALLVAVAAALGDARERPARDDRGASAAPEEDADARAR